MIHKLAKRITEKPRFVLFVAILLLIPALLGYIGTRTNYDVLSYLPKDVRSVQGEQLLEDPFQAAATSMVVVEGMPIPSAFRFRPICSPPNSATTSMRARQPS